MVHLQRVIHHKLKYYMIFRFYNYDLDERLHKCQLYQINLYCYPINTFTVYHRILAGGLGSAPNIGGGVYTGLAP